MKKNVQEELSKYKSRVASGELEELRFFVSKGVGDRFRQAAKKYKLTTHALLEEMVEIYMHNRPGDRE